MVVGRGPTLLADELFLDRRKHLQPLRQPGRIDPHVEIANIAVGVDDERRPRHSQESRADAPAADGNEGGNLEIGHLIRQFVGNHGAVAGVLDVGIRHVARVHVVAAAHVVCLARAHRSHERHVVHLLGHQRHVLADLDPIGAGRDRLEGAAGRRPWLEIPDVHGAGAASHPKENGRLVPLLQVSGIGEDRVGKGRRRGGEGRCARDMAHEVSAAHPVNETAGGGHGGNPQGWTRVRGAVGRLSWGRTRDRCGDQWLMMNSFELRTAHQMSWRALMASPLRATII